MAKGNPNPVPKVAKHGAQLVQRTRAIILNAMDVLDNRGKPLSELAADAAEANPLKFLEMAAKHCPKDVNLAVLQTHTAKALTDDELADIIAQRAREKANPPKIIEATPVTTPQLDNIPTLTQTQDKSK